MKTFTFILVVGQLLLASYSFSQSKITTLNETAEDRSWFITVGFNVVDDSGDEYRDLFSISEEWNYVVFPSRLSLGKNFKNGIGLEIVGSYNQYQDGKTIDGVVITDDIDYLSADFRVNYDLNQILGETGFFDPYIGIGVGYTDANNQGRGTYNALFGFRTWFSDRWGLDFSSTGKWTMNSENSTNHIQHAVGLAYRFGLPKKSGQEEYQLAMKETEEIPQSPVDSIAEAPEEPEQVEDLAKLAKEKEELAKLEAERKMEEEEKMRRLEIENKIKALEPVYFELNSSYLSDGNKRLLDAWSEVLMQTPDVKVKVSGHTDSRGTNEYNQWLSKRRAIRVVDYLHSRGVDPARVSFEAFGETKLTNNCDDFNKCSEAKHSKNRRVSVSIK